MFSDPGDGFANAVSLLVKEYGLEKEVPTVSRQEMKDQFTLDERRQKASLFGCVEKLQ